MAAPPPKKLKTDTRRFHDEWKIDFFFILPDGQNMKPTCLICGGTIAVIKRYDIQRHYNTKHKDTFEKKYPPGSEERKKRMEHLAKSHAKSVAVFSRGGTAQEKAAEVSLRVSWILNKNKLPFTASEVVKECMVETAKVLCPEKVETFKKIPLSNDTNTRRSEVLANNLKDELLEKLKVADAISLAIDESTDITDVAQLALFVRFLDESSGTFREELLELLPLTGSTTSSDIFSTISSFFDAHGISIAKVKSLLTDGAPAMVGKKTGVAARMKEVSPGLLSFHCLIHNSVLCAKINNDFAEPLNKLIEIVNFLRAKSSKQHRDLRTFLQDEEAEYFDIPLHTAVRWLSKGEVLKRMWTLRAHIVSYLGQSTDVRAKKHLGFMTDDGMMTKIAFLVDIFTHLNGLNLKLQGRGKSLAACRKTVKTFQGMLPVYLKDLTKDKKYFPTLKEYGPNAIVGAEFVQKLMDEFHTRFADFKNLDSILLVVTQPFLVDPTDERWLEQAGAISPDMSQQDLQEQLIELQADDELKLQFNGQELEKFWIELTGFPVLRSMSTKILTIFGSTYICEQCFSNMNFIKNKYRNRITNTHLCNVLRVAITSVKPNFSALAKSGRSHFSHQI
ncbi:SCAN domain-containing protein 3-like [Lytechinus pictus]|uniref:SCAN domain-containing protein 3-like n=2 Tax=Lytechinus pictus TaxID=7653 RepID=UPI0030BA0B8D